MASASQDSDTHPAQSFKGKAPQNDGGRAEQLKIWVPVILLAIVAFGFTFTRLEPPAPRHLKLAAGSPAGAYTAFGQGYAEFLAKQDYTLEVVETAGSVDNLERLLAGEVDLAILQGGVAEPALHGDRLEVIAAVFFEPLWVFHRAEAEVDLIPDLEGRRVAVGPEGSGTRALALDILADNGLDETNTRTVPLGSKEAGAALLAGELDAAFFVASPSAGYVRELLADERVSLLPIRRHRAYKIRHPFLSPVVLGEGVIDLERGLPPEDVPLVAAAAALVAPKDLHHALVPLLVQATEEVHGGAGLFEEAGHFPTALHTDLELKTEAAHYLENGPSFLYRILPYRTATVVDRLKILLLPFIPLLLVVFKMAPPLYRWRIRSKIYRWYEDLRELDLLLLSDPTPDQIGQALKTVDRLELEVTEVSVPLSYMDEFYSLRLHIELIEKKLAELIQRSAG